MKKIKKRYYFWQFSNYSGWRQLGKMSGYETLTECKKENDFYIKQNSEGYTILEAKPIEKNK